MAPLTVGTEFSGYRIEAVLGRGGMSVVYLAHHLRLRRKVALKILAAELAENDRFRERFVRESQLAASIDHPNIIPVYEAGENDGVLFIVMRYNEGSDLAKIIRLEGRLPPARTRHLLDQVASALDAAHARGLIHRDVKPANILVLPAAGHGGGDHVYLADFGLTKQVTSKTGLTMTGEFVGTLDYIAPEQIRGEPVDGRADVYALGCVLFTCLAGAPPYRRENDAAVIFAHIAEPVPRLSPMRPDLDLDIDNVIATAMAKSKEDRYPTCGSLMSAAGLALTAEQPATTSQVPTVVYPPRPSLPAKVPPSASLAHEPADRTRRRLPTSVRLGLALILMLGAAGAGILLAHRGDTTPHTTGTTSTGNSAQGNASTTNSAVGTARPAPSPAFLDNLTSVNGEPDRRGVVVANGHSFAESLAFDVNFVQTPKGVTYNLGGKYSSFEATLAVDGNERGSVVEFQVLSDGKVVVDQIVTLGTSTPASVQITGTDQLQIIATWKTGAPCTAVVGSAQVKP